MCVTPPTNSENSYSVYKLTYVLFHAKMTYCLLQLEQAFRLPLCSVLFSWHAASLPCLSLLFVTVVCSVPDNCHACVCVCVFVCVCVCMLFACPVSG